MWVYSLCIKFSTVCYFNNALFKVAYSMPYCLLAFNDSFLATLFLMLSFQMLYFYVEIIIIFFKIILFFMLH